MLCVSSAPWSDCELGYCAALFLCDGPDLMMLFISFVTILSVCSLKVLIWFKSDLRIKKFDTWISSLFVDAWSNPRFVVPELSCLKFYSLKNLRFAPYLNLELNVLSDLLMILTMVGTLIFLAHLLLCKSWMPNGELFIPCRIRFELKPLRPTGMFAMSAFPLLY